MQKERGFTLLELTAILVVMAILGGVFIAFRYSVLNSVSVALQAQGLQSNLDYLRARALGYHQSIQVLFDPDGSACNIANQPTYCLITTGILFPGTQYTYVLLPSDIVLSVNQLPSNILTFGQDGLPTTNGVITISSADGGAHSVLMSSGSGSIILN